MLACAQDLFFNNDKPLPRQNSFQSSSSLQHPTQQQQQQQQEQQQQQQRTNANLQKMKLGKKSHMSTHHPSEKDKEEQVWPPEVESSFIEALETIPKLGRRKILVNGKPCGRNELISDFILRKTSKVRTRKQVSSHIQVLKNTRKNDPHFMRLLTDSMDLENEFVHRKMPKAINNKRPQQKHHPHRQQQQFFQHQHHHHNTSLGKLATSSSISSDESSIHSSPSPADYVFDMMYGDNQALSMLDMKDSFYDTLHHPLFDTNTSGLVGASTSSTRTSTPTSTMITGVPSRFTDLTTPCNTTMALTPTSASIDSSACFNLLPMDTSSDQLHSPGDMDDLHQTGGMEQQQHSRYYPHQQQQSMHDSTFQQLHYNTSSAMIEQLTPTCKWRHGNHRLQKDSYAPRQQHRRKENQHSQHLHMSDEVTLSTATHYSIGQKQQAQCQPLDASSSSTGLGGVSFSNTLGATNATTMTTMPSPFTNAPLWPNYLCLYLEHASVAASSNLDLSSDARAGCSHTLAQLPHCFPGANPTHLNSSSTTTLKERYHSLMQIHPSLSLISSDATLFAKMKLDLNFSMDDFIFNNTCFFESKDRRMIECTTTIYSFGNIVLESKEMQQALWIDEDKYLYNFVYVNQFFDAFMKGIRSLQSWEEVDISIHNLCIIQVFEDIESKCQAALDQDIASDPATASAEKMDSHGDDLQRKNHLLALIYEFERGQGTIDMTCMGDDL